MLLNGVAAGGAALPAIDGRNRAHLLLDLPVHEMGPASRLDVAFRLVGLEQDECLGEWIEPMWGTVHSDTSITLPRERWAQINDISLGVHAGRYLRGAEGAELILGQQGAGGIVGQEHDIARAQRAPLTCKLATREGGAGEGAQGPGQAHLAAYEDGIGACGHARAHPEAEILQHRPVGRRGGRCALDPRHE